MAIRDGASGKGTTEHVGESQREELVRGLHRFGHNELHGTSRIFATVTGGIVAERAHARIAVVSRETAIALASLGTHLVPHLVVGVVKGHVLSVDVVIVEAASVTTAVVRATGATATPALKTVKALAFARSVVTGTAARALGVLVEVGSLGVQRFEGCLEVGLGKWICVGGKCIELGLANVTAWGGQGDPLGIPVVHQVGNRGDRPGWANWAGTVAAIAPEESFVAFANVTGATGPTSTAAIRTTGAGKANESGNGDE